MRVSIRTLLPLFFALTMHAQGKPTTLAALRDQARPLLIFGGAQDTRVQQQYAEMAAHAIDAKERYIRVALITNPPSKAHRGPHAPEVTFTPEEQGLLRKKFDISPKEFTVVLVGKDGGEKLRSQLPIPWSKLAETIDSMPMRQDEMKQR